MILSACAIAMSPCPIEEIRCFESLRPSAFAAAVSSVSSGFTWRRRSSRSSISRPIFADVFCSSTRIHWRILWRARPVRTCASQSRLGLAVGEVTISTVSEFRSSRESGAMRPFTFAPWQCSPTSVCTAKAKSIGVAPSGSSITSPVGVRTKISF